MKNRKGNVCAQKFLENCGLTSPTELPIEEIIASEGAFVQTSKIDGAEGRIIFDSTGSNAIITISDSIKLEAKRRFVLAHELGHLIMHRDKKKILTDTNLTLSEFTAKEIIEVEANAFASEYLMPENEFRRLCDRKLDLKQIKRISDNFHTSITATLLRFKDIGNYPIAVIYSEKGFIKWKFFSEDFVLSFIPPNSQIPYNTIAYDIYQSRYNESEPELVNAIDWFPNDFNIKQFKNWKFFEYSFKVSKTGILTCLWGY
jgi:hypothetical protein